MKINKISEILKRLLFEHDLKIMDLARLTKVPQQTIQRLVAGYSTRPHEKSLIPIAKYFNLSLEQLRGEKPITQFDRTEEVLQTMGVRRVPLLAWTQVDDWLGSSLKNADNLPKVFTDLVISERSFALRIKDASMAPMFPVGTIVIFDPEREAKDRYYILVGLKNHDEPVFRQLLLDANDKLIKPISPDLDHFRVHQLDENDCIYAILVEAKQQYMEI